MLGDGTGCGKGREVAGIILDKPPARTGRRALWLSQSDKLLEDARRDWTALGGRWKATSSRSATSGRAWRYPLDEGILFCDLRHAALAVPARASPSRLDQIVEWLAGSLDEEDRHAFDGVIVFDEAHAMANAAGSKSERGRDQAVPAGKGRAQRLQNALPDARIAYVSATGAHHRPRPRLCREGSDCGAPARRRSRSASEFVSAMEAGGVAAMEVVARDLKALGLYQARALRL